MSRNARISAIKQNLRALLFTFCNQRLDSVLALAANYRSHLHTFIKPITYAQGGRCRDDRIAKCLLCLADSYRHGNSQASLTSASESAVANDLSSHAHVGIGKNDDVVLRAALALGAFTVSSGASI